MCERILTLPLAQALTQYHGINWRVSHQIVGIMVRKADERGLKPNEITPELLAEASREYNGQEIYISQDDLRTLMDPVRSVERKKLYGAPAPSEALSRIQDFAEELEADRLAIEGIRKSLAQAEALLEKTIEQIILA